MRTAKTLIRLGGCTGWSESSLGAQVILLVLSWGGSFYEDSILISSEKAILWKQGNHPWYEYTRVAFNGNWHIWTASSEFGTYRLREQRRFRRVCASTQSRQNLRCSLIQAVNQEESSDRKPDPLPLWMAGHAQLKFVMAECSKTQIGLTGPICTSKRVVPLVLPTLVTAFPKQEASLGQNKVYVCFLLSWPYLGCCPNPKHVIVKTEQIIQKTGKNPRLLSKP